MELGTFMMHLKEWNFKKKRGVMSGFFRLDIG
ncbi:Hypothetical protein Minf_2080 [Methylacidiphilum infernorum V4]|uniref:Uncharacterized protein n=1 Tax=Methylacidiphilum infernorum (isolate V4) TaxID=481448 RepID=B3DZ42_METI4|nr:Hypothetical protein Minf_2080 [Methylacidiphilum infernorum V4]